MTPSDLHLAIQARLQEIASYLPPYYQLTLVARCENPELGTNADVILTTDQNLDAVVQSIERLKDSERMYAAENSTPAG